MANGSNQQSDGLGLLWIGLAVLLFPGVAMVLLMLGLVVALVVKAPKITGVLIVAATVNGFIHFLMESDSSSGDTGFMLIPVVLLFLLFIAAGCKLFAWGQGGGMASATALANPPNIPLLPEPGKVWNSADEIGNQTDEEEIRAAVEEAKTEARRIMKLSNCPPDQKKKLFESVFRRKCQQCGVKASRVVWRRRDHSHVNDEMERSELTT